jgi:hypothetical protein
MGGFSERSWAPLLLLGAGSDGFMGIHKRGPHGGLLACGRSKSGPGVRGVVRSLYSGFGLLLLEGVVRPLLGWERMALEAATRSGSV